MSSFLSLAGAYPSNPLSTPFYTENPTTGGFFGVFSNGGYLAGTATIDTPNVSTVPASTVNNNGCNGALTNQIIEQGDNSSQANTIGSGCMGVISSTPTLNGGIGFINKTNWGTAFGDLNDPTQFGPPSSNAGDQNSPGTMNTDTDIYTLVMASGEAQGQSNSGASYARIIYEASVGNLIDTLLKIQPSPGEGFPPTGFGVLSAGLSDERSAAVWLSFGYGLFKGGAPEFWTQ